MLSADQFWIAVVKVLPYETTTAYGLIVGAYSYSTGDSVTAWLFFAVAALTIFVFALHRAATGASNSTALATAMLFFLLALTLHANVIRPWLIDQTIAHPPLPTIFDFIVRPFPTLVIAVLFVLSTAGLRGILARQSA